MESPVLVDSCVFITLLKTGRDPGRELLGRIDSTDLATCGMVRLEVIRGLATPRARQGMDAFFDVMQNIRTDNNLWEDACELGRKVTRKGNNMPAQDIIIAACALRVGAAVFTYDRHFDAIPGLTVMHSIEEMR